ncbi:P-loop containing nucleoside triphosphate hydrolase protein, partial [Rhizoctonia solani]
MHWLCKQPAWGRSREFETTTRSNVPGAMTSSFGDEFEDLEAEDDDAPGKQKMRVVFMPTLDTTHTIYYKGHWLRVCRSRQSNGDELLSISVVARSNNILKQLVLEAKKEYERDAEHRVQIFFADSHGSWRWTDSRQKRPMSSIVLAPGVKEMLLSDTRDFLKSEKWYADRGIPFRRGYLLHGVPGSGKSSLIHAIAGELALDIYVVSLSSSWINDATLTALMGRVPARCIVLLEDLDAAFTRSTSRDQQSTGAPTADKKEDGKDNNDSNNKEEKKQEDINTLSLSGLLNALDGVAASEGRILFATTNHLERLDPALSRPAVWTSGSSSKTPQNGNASSYSTTFSPPPRLTTFRPAHHPRSRKKSVRQVSQSRTMNVTASAAKRTRTSSGCRMGRLRRLLPQPNAWMRPPLRSWPRSSPRPFPRRSFRLRRCRAVS